MTSDDPPCSSVAPTARPLVVRSEVADGTPYAACRETLRYDFFYCCGYCTMSEAEATAIRFTIDHYEPRRARPDLENAYSNLIYACDECNERKGDRTPPEAARAAGYRFFRPDNDVHEDHFRGVGIRIEGASPVGEYSIEALDLNRQGLRRLRGLRDRLYDCDEAVVRGIHALRKSHIDRLPPETRARASTSIRQAENMATQIAEDIDGLLRRAAKSELIDPDPEAKGRNLKRREWLQQLQTLFPGEWRGRSSKTSR